MGVVAGLALPVLCTIVFELIFKNVWIFNKRGVPYLVAIALNLFILKYFAKKQNDKTAQGIMLVTFIFMLAVFIFRFRI